MLTPFPAHCPAGPCAQGLCILSLSPAGPPSPVLWTPPLSLTQGPYPEREGLYTVYAVQMRPSSNGRCPHLKGEFTDRLACRRIPCEDEGRDLQAKGCQSLPENQQKRGAGMHRFSLSPQQRQTRPTPGSLTSGLRHCETKRDCCLSNWGCGASM